MFHKGLENTFPFCCRRKSLCVFQAKASAVRRGQKSVSLFGVGLRGSIFAVTGKLVLQKSVELFVTRLNL
jgi:hypothetical protein